MTETPTITYTFTKDNQKLEHLLPILLSSNITNNYPKYSELIKLYLKYLDENYYKWVITWGNNANYLKIFAQEVSQSFYKRIAYPNIEDAINDPPVYRITSGDDYREISPKTRTEEEQYNDDDLLYHYYQTYFKDVIPKDSFFVGDNEKRIYIVMSKLINNYKGNENSFYALLKYLGKVKIVDDEVEARVKYLTDFDIEITQEKTYWNIVRPTLSGNLAFERAFTYNYKLESAVGVYSLFELMMKINPAGFDVRLNFPSWPFIEYAGEADPNDVPPKVPIKFNSADSVILSVEYYQPTVYDGTDLLGGTVKFNGIKLTGQYFTEI